MTKHRTVFFDLAYLPEDISVQEAIDFFKENGVGFVHSENTSEDEVNKYLGKHYDLADKQTFDMIIEDIREWRFK